MVNKPDTQIIQIPNGNGWSTRQLMSLTGYIIIAVGMSLSILIYFNSSQGEQDRDRREIEKTVIKIDERIKTISADINAIKSAQIDQAKALQEIARKVN